jgi:hypothetical protein
LPYHRVMIQFNACLHVTGRESSQLRFMPMLEIHSTLLITHGAEPTQIHERAGGPAHSVDHVVGYCVETSMGKRQRAPIPK